MSDESFEVSLARLASHLAALGMDKDTNVQDSVKIFKELREYYAVLTEGDPKGDKDQGRRPITIQSMRDRIAVVSHGDDDGRTTPSVQGRGD